MRYASIAPIRTHHRTTAAGTRPPAVPGHGRPGATPPAARRSVSGPLGGAPSPFSGDCGRADPWLHRPLAERLAGASALGAAALLAGCTMFGGDREDEIPQLLPLKPQAAVETPWSADTGSGVGRHFLVLAPAVTNGRVYVADARGRVSAWDAASGRSAWRTDTNADITGGVGAGGGLVVAGTENGEVIALRAESGEEVWRAQLSSEVLSRPGVAGDQVIARTLDGKLFGLDAASGEMRWTYDGGVPSLSVRGTGSPVIESGVAYTGFDNGRIAAVRSATGELVWEGLVANPRGRSELERLADVDTDPVLAGGVVYAASYERAVAAFDAETGRPIWRRNIASRSGLAADGDLLYVADTAGAVQALDRASGAGVWTEESLAGRAPAWPIVHGAYVAVTDAEGYVHWLRREDGRPVARTRSGAGPIAGPPARHDDALIAYWGGGRLTAFRVR